MQKRLGFSLIAAVIVAGFGATTAAQAQLAHSMSAGDALGGLQVTAISAARKKKLACKPEPGCPCVKGRQVCH